MSSRVTEFLAIAQWKAVIDNNNVERVGSWVNDNTNYSSAIIL